VKTRYEWVRQQGHMTLLETTQHVRKIGEIRSVYRSIRGVEYRPVLFWATGMQRYVSFGTEQEAMDYALTIARMSNA
jgi:hypothetical protein